MPSQVASAPSIKFCSIIRQKNPKNIGHLLPSLQCVSKQTFQRLDVGVKRPLQKRGSGGGSRGGGICYSSVFKTGLE